jgi:hypothetical protein
MCVFRRGMILSTLLIVRVAIVQEKSEKKTKTTESPE